MNQHHLYIENEWASIATGDEAAFSRFYRATNAGLYHAVITYVKDEHVARDIVQQVYIKVWDKRTMIGEVRSAKDFLFVLGRNAILDHFRKCTIEKKYLAGFRTHAVLTDEGFLPSVHARECGNLLRQVISKLPSQQREAYILASEENMSYDTIADRMKVSRFTVKRHLELARRFVRKQMQHYFSQEGVLPILIIFSTFFY